MSAISIIMPQFFNTPSIGLFLTRSFYMSEFHILIGQIIIIYSSMGLSAFLPERKRALFNPEINVWAGQFVPKVSIDLKFLLFFSLSESRTFLGSGHGMCF